MHATFAPARIPADPFDQQFPDAHVNCRCSEGLEFDRDAEPSGSGRTRTTPRGTKIETGPAPEPESAPPGPGLSGRMWNAARRRRTHSYEQVRDGIPRFLDSLSDAERAAISDYTGGGFEGLNSKLTAMARGSRFR